MTCYLKILLSLAALSALSCATAPRTPPSTSPAHEAAPRPRDVTVRSATPSADADSGEADIMRDPDATRFMRVEYWGGHWNGVKYRADFWSDGTVDVDRLSRSGDAGWRLRLTPEQQHKVTSGMPLLELCEKDRSACACDAQDTPSVQYWIFRGRRIDEFTHVHRCFDSVTEFIEYENYLLSIMRPPKYIGHSDF